MGKQPVKQPIKQPTKPPSRPPAKQSTKLQQSIQQFSKKQNEAHRNLDRNDQDDGGPDSGDVADKNDVPASDANDGGLSDEFDGAGDGKDEASKGNNQAEEDNGQDGEENVEAEEESAEADEDGSGIDYDVAGQNDDEDEDGDEDFHSAKRRKLTVLPWCIPAKSFSGKGASLRVQHQKMRKVVGGRIPAVIPVSNAESVYGLEVGGGSPLVDTLPPVTTAPHDVLATELASQFGLQHKETYTRDMYFADSREDPNPIIKAKVTSTRTGWLDPNVPPMHTMKEIFGTIGKRALDLGFEQAIKCFSGQGLRTVTMCSGTESPIIAMNQLNDALKDQGQSGFVVDHLASAEIEPFKQAYIHRNFHPNILFRDVTEFSKDKEKAHTAFGSYAQQPVKPHVLIAGSSCIDYSNLNNKKKDFGEVGESQQTMLGVFAYASNHRPLLIILENVQSAPWDKVEEMWNGAGYFCVVMQIDTKDFYIPQTRQRGYMVCFDRKRAEEIGLDLKKAARVLWSSLNTLSQRASAPYTAFILSDDDPELKAAVSALALRDDTGQRPTPWEACRVRYADFRTQHQLGRGRPVTNWKAGGKMLFADYAAWFWTRNQRERILDTIDINLLQYLAERGYDFTFKNRWIELSQNVDRDMDSRQWGIVNCITPHGMPWDSRRGAPVFGREALALQGIPGDGLSLNEETSRQLQDLAGNAMTSTVIGCVIVSAILASSVDVVEQTSKSESTGLSMFEDFGLPITNSAHLKSIEAASKFAIIEALDRNPSDDSMRSISVTVQGSVDSFHDLKKIAAGTLSICKCDDGLITSRETYRMCKSCKHTACTSCAGNPRHDYGPILPAPSVRKSFSREYFIEAIRQSLPPALKLSAPGMHDSIIKISKGARQIDDQSTDDDETGAAPLNNAEAARYQSAILAAVESTIYLQFVKSDSMWRVIFQSEDARLELRFIRNQTDSDTSDTDADIASCTWLLFALPDPKEPALSAVRDLLKYPIARMCPVDKSFLKGKWQFWDPSMPYGFLDFQGLGTQLPAWEQKVGLQQPKFHNLQVPSKLNIRSSQTGNENLDPVARKVLNGLTGSFEWLEFCGTACGSLFKRVQTTTIVQPAYFFLDPEPLRNAVIDRMVFANTHERNPSAVRRQVSADIRKGWRPNSLNFDDSAAAENVACRLIDIWHDDIDISLSDHMSQQGSQAWSPTTVRTDLSDCTKTDVLLVTKISAADAGHNLNIANKPSFLNLVDQAGALTEFQWILKHTTSALRQPTPVLIDVPSIIDECSTCASQPPSLKWCYICKGKIPTVKPFEDPEAAANYERSLVKRPAPITAEVCKQGTCVWIIININLATAFHRLQGKLHFNNQNGQLSWQMVKSDMNQVCPTFPKLLPTSNDSQAAWPVGDAAYLNQSDVEKPKLFKRTLWNGQRKALARMLAVEAGSQWQEWDAESFDAPAIDAQLFVEAKKTVGVHGGIIADEVGAGKTTTSLALIARQLEMLPAWPAVPTANNAEKIKSRASLILVPANIMKQWEKEIDICLSRQHAHTTVLGSRWRNLSFTDLSQADIILAPSDLFSNDEYWNAIREVCCAPNTPKSPARACKQWLEEAILDLNNIVSECGPDMDLQKFLDHRTKQKLIHRTKYTAFSAFAEGKVTRKQAQKDLKATASKMNTGLHTPDAIEASTETLDLEFDKVFDWPNNKTIPALLHMFEFERVIVDEFTYLDARGTLAIQKLVSKHKWMLSGTPPLAHAESINAMASMIGTKVSPEADNKAYFSFKDARLITHNEKSYAEEFREKIQKRSPTWFEARNQRSAAFVRGFVRKNAGQKAATRKFEKFVVIPLSPIEEYITNKIFHLVTSQQIVFGSKKDVSPEDSDEDQLRTKVQQATTPDEALLTCHANFVKYYYTDNDITDVEVSRNNLQTLKNSAKDQQAALQKQLQNLYGYWNGGVSVDDKANPQLTTFFNGILTMNCGDPTVAEILKWTTSFARENAVEPAESRPDAIARRRKHILDEVTNVNVKSRSLVGTVQQVRLASHIDSIIRGISTVPCCLCSQSIEIKNLNVLNQCGHILCNDCIQKPVAHSWDINTCPIEGCFGSTKDCHTPASAYARGNVEPATSHGSKIQAIVRQVKAINTDEKILIFIQFNAHRDELVRAFKDNNIEHADGTSRAASTTIRAFQSGKGEAQVLLLRIDSPDSAGWNLQIASHVMFVAPLLARTQYDYEATLIQAIGRAYRYGQERDVHVYHFLSARTLDVNIIEGWTGGKLVRRGNGSYEVVARGSAAAQAAEDLAGATLEGV